MEQMSQRKDYKLTFKSVRFTFRTIFVCLFVYLFFKLVMFNVRNKMDFLKLGDID